MSLPDLSMLIPINLRKPKGEIPEVRVTNVQYGRMRRLTIDVPCNYPGLSDEEKAQMERGVDLIEGAYTDAKKRMSL